MRKLRILGISLVCVQGLLWSQVSPAQVLPAFTNFVYVLQTGYVNPDPDPSIPLVPGVDQTNGRRFVASTIGLVVRTDATGKPETVVVVDPGFTNNRRAIVAALNTVEINGVGLGLTATDVTDVFFSHHHPDHTANAALFPNAKLVDFWATYDGDLWADHPDNHFIARGIKVIRTPGHTYEDASLVVNTGAGVVVFSHVWWFWSPGFTAPDGTEFPLGAAPAQDPIGANQLQLDASRELILSSGTGGQAPDCIIPGHGAPFVPGTGDPCTIVETIVVP